MPYQTITYAQLAGHVSDVMDDISQVYWTQDEIIGVIQEGLRVWGAYTNYWRARGSFDILPSNNSPYYDMSVLLPLLRPRTITNGQMIREIQTMMLEQNSGASGSGMSGQVTIDTITQALSASRNRFILDCHLPYNIGNVTDPPPPSGMVEYAEHSAYVHRASWQDAYSGVWGTLWRQDSWAADRGDLMWTINPGIPIQFSEAENSPLRIQLVPPPVNTGKLELITANSFIIASRDDLSIYNLPDEWMHAVKYAALSHIFNGEGQIKDVVRGEYAEKRYQQAVDMAREARTVIRLLVNGVPVNMDTLYNIDAGNMYWRNQTGPPQIAGAMYDILMISPGIPDQMYGATVDLVQSAPIVPDPNAFVPIGEELLDVFIDYVTHVLVFKCGGQDFTSTYTSYDNFMATVGKQTNVNRVRIQYMTPILGQPQKEWQQRPDRLETSRA